MWFDFKKSYYQNKTFIWRHVQNKEIYKEKFILQLQNIINIQETAHLHRHHHYDPRIYAMGMRTRCSTNEVFDPVKPTRNTSRSHSPLHPTHCTNDLCTPLRPVLFVSSTNVLNKNTKTKNTKRDDGMIVVEFITIEYAKLKLCYQLKQKQKQILLVTMNAMVVKLLLVTMN